MITRLVPAKVLICTATPLRSSGSPPCSRSCLWLRARLTVSPSRAMAEYLPSALRCTLHPLTQSRLGVLSNPVLLTPPSHGCLGSPLPTSVVTPHQLTHVGHVVAAAAGVHSSLGTQSSFRGYRCRTASQPRPHHAVVLTREGEVHKFGSFAGRDFVHPTKVDFPSGVKIRQISAGTIKGEKQTRPRIHQISVLIPLSFLFYLS